VNLANSAWPPVVSGPVLRDISKAQRWRFGPTLRAPASANRIEGLFLSLRRNRSLLSDIPFLVFKGPFSVSAVVGSCQVLDPRDRRSSRKRRMSKVDPVWQDATAARTLNGA
jgi:hypothetical protein